MAKKPGVFFYHCGAPPMIQHVARGMFGAIIVDPKNTKSWPKADREYVLIQSELFENPDDVQAMFDRKFAHIIFNGGIFKYHPYVTGGHALEAKPGERVRIYFVNAGPNEFSAFHPIGEIWDNVYESGNPANKLSGVQTYVVGPGSAATFDVVVESAGAYPLVTHSLTGALHGAIVQQSEAIAFSAHAPHALEGRGASDGNHAAARAIAHSSKKGPLFPYAGAHAAPTNQPGCSLLAEWKGDYKSSHDVTDFEIRLRAFAMRVVAFDARHGKTL